MLWRYGRLPLPASRNVLLHGLVCQGAAVRTGATHEARQSITLLGSDTPVLRKSAPSGPLGL